MLMAAARFARDVRDRQKTGVKPHWLAYLGKSGTGKTRLGRRLFDCLAGRFSTEHCAFNPHAVYWPKFVDSMRERVRDGGGLGLFRDMAKWPLLFLDDVGAERDSTGFASEKLNQLLALRVGRWTLLTSNLGLAGLAKIDERIASRIVREPGNQFVEVTAPDYATRIKP